MPQDRSALVYLARVSNDGYEKLKGKRIEREGSELPAVIEAFTAVRSSGVAVNDERSITIAGRNILGGAEWSPQEWLPQPPTPDECMRREQERVAESLLGTVGEYPDLASRVLSDFPSWISGLPLPYGSPPLQVSELFEVVNGKSSGEKNYLEGDIPYISSGDLTNSIVGLVTAADGEVFEHGGITVTAFGQAFIQAWPFVARGNGGSSVRVLTPRYRMSLPELMWFAAQINVQRWRFFYARMAIKSRITRLRIELPPAAMVGRDVSVRQVIDDFLGSFHTQRSLLSGGE